MATQRRLSRIDFPSGPPKKRVSNEFFKIAVWQKKEGLETKFACVVSKKVARRAVERNKLKRRCREITSRYLSSIATPCSIVIYPKKYALMATFDELRQAFDSIARTLSLG